MANLMRSFLFVPGNRPERFAKAAASGTDIYCIDLEDAVAAGDKQAAREAALAHIAQRKADGATTPLCYLRINGLSSAEGLKDLLALATLADNHQLPDCIVLPMASAAYEITQIVRVLGDHPNLAIMPMIETPDGVDHLPAMIAASHKVVAIGCGFADYVATTGSQMDWDALLSARNAIIAAASRSKVPCLDTPWFDIKDEAGLRNEAQKVLRLGFKGKLAIHPAQVGVINDTFVPSAQEVRWAEDVLEVFNRTKGGVGSFNGLMVDKPIADKAKAILLAANKTP
jgi:citrate lyase beta subunit